MEPVVFFTPVYFPQPEPIAILKAAADWLLTPLSNGKEGVLADVASLSNSRVIVPLVDDGTTLGGTLLKIVILATIIPFILACIVRGWERCNFDFHHVRELPVTNPSLAVGYETEEARGIRLTADTDSRLANCWKMVDEIEQLATVSAREQSEFVEEMIEGEQRQRKFREKIEALKVESRAGIGGREREMRHLIEMAQFWSRAEKLSLRTNPNAAAKAREAIERAGGLSALHLTQLDKRYNDWKKALLAQTHLRLDALALPHLEKVTDLDTKTEVVSTYKRWSVYKETRMHGAGSKLVAAPEWARDTEDVRKHTSPFVSHLAHLYAATETPTLDTKNVVVWKSQMPGAANTWSRMSVHSLGIDKPMHPDPIAEGKFRKTFVPQLKAII